MSIRDSEHQVLYQSGREAMEKGNFAKAIEQLEKSAYLHPHFKTYESIGECFLHLDKPRQAVIFLAAAAAAGIGNKQSRSYFLLAKALLAGCHIESAKEKLDQAIEINPDYKAALELLSTISSDG